MSDEEEFDSEKTQFWLPGQALPERPVAGAADGDHEGVNLKKPPQGVQSEAVSATSSGQIDFDLTAEQPGSGELDLDLSAAEDTSTMDFDITGEGTIPPQPEAEPAPRTTAPAAAANPAPAPAPAESSSGSGGMLVFVVVAVVVAGVIYFLTR